MRAMLVVCVAMMLILGASNAAQLDDLMWLTGCWRSVSPRGTVIDEEWRRVSRDTMAGTSRTLRGGAVVESEILHLVARGDSIVYIAEPSRQARAEFVATTVTATLANFDNPQHDFPQRISYRAAPDSLLARIEGAVNGNVRAVDFRYARVACERDDAKRP